MKRTTKLRYLMQERGRILNSLDQQARSPSRGFSEDAAFLRLDTVNDDIDAELDQIDRDFA